MEDPWTIRRLLEWTARHFTGKGLDSPRLDAELLLAHALECPRIILYTRVDEEPAEAQRTRFRDLVKQRLEGRPVAHLLGRKEFFSYEFEVSPAVLIPRPDSEWLVTHALELLKPLESPRVLDLGTGSGCLAISLALRHRGAQITAVDLSPAALEVARRNAERHKVTDRIHFLEGDLFAPLDPTEQFDLLLSNPPYIRHADLASLEADVRDYEPHLALDGGDDGFAVIDRILAGAPARLTAQGSLVFEIGHDQETAGQERFARVGGWEPVRTIHDAAGHPRVLSARRVPA
ncbi:MAG: peptide chain release factor N(5)-glutamine methyltransferase [Gemmataceae bacterium]